MTCSIAALRDPEIKSYLETTETPTVLVPIGATEQHGKHLCLGTDSMLAVEVCERVAPKIDALIAPPLQYGASQEHVGFSVVYLGHETLVTVLKDIAYSLAETGFKDVVFIDGHYSNEAAITIAANEVLRELPPETYVYGFPYWETLDQETLGEFLSLENGLHANIGETSGMLAIDEEFVNLDAAVPEEPQLPKDIPNPNALILPSFVGPATTYRTTETGTWGDPTDATAEKGEEFLEAIAEAVVTTIDAFQSNRDTLYHRDPPDGSR